jgi:hypothetical protein
VRDELTGSAQEADELGRAVGERLLAAGARDLLEQAERTADGAEISAP